MRRLFALITPVFLTAGMVAFTAQPAAAWDEGPNRISITTDNGKLPGNSPTGARASISGGLSNKRMTIEIKGNSSAAWPKKPYGIVFDEPQSPFGLPADREWRLLANYHDRSLLRNYVAFDLGRHLSGLQWTPRTHFAELRINGKYLGSYQLIETIKIAPDRVNISGGGAQVVEFDPSGNLKFKDSRGMYNSFYSPESTSNYTATKNKVNRFNWYMETGRPWPNLIDKASFVDYYLVREFTKDKDADFLYSNFWYTPSGDPNDKIFMGPIWDFDRSAGNEVSTTTIASYKYWWMRGDGVHEPYNSQHWYVQLTKFPTFREWLCQRWTQVRYSVFKAAGLDNGPIDRGYKELSGLAAANDTKLWGGGEMRPPKRGSGYSGEIKYLRNWYLQRYYWMNANIC